METKTVDQSVTFQASAHQVYEMLADSAKHTAFTGVPAEISREVGGEFSAYGGALTGKNLELVPDKRIVQSWRAASDEWPEDHYSTAIFALEESGGKTRLSFTQAGVPVDAYENISKGWHEHYWSKIKEALEK
jgi:activator of HSP90 ATPase